jgi:hypothetical protein
MERRVVFWVVIDAMIGQTQTKEIDVRHWLPQVGSTLGWIGVMARPMQVSRKHVIFWLTDVGLWLTQANEIDARPWLMNGVWTWRPQVVRRGVIQCHVGVRHYSERVEIVDVLPWWSWMVKGVISWQTRGTENYVTLQVRQVVKTRDSRYWRERYS